MNIFHRIQCQTTAPPSLALFSEDLQVIPNQPTHNVPRQAPWPEGTVVLASEGQTSQTVHPAPSRPSLPNPFQESVFLFLLLFLCQSREWMLAVTNSQLEVPNVGFDAWTRSDPRSPLSPWVPWLLELPKILEATDMEWKKRKHLKHPTDLISSFFSFFSNKREIQTSDSKVSVLTKFHKSHKNTAIERYMQFCTFLSSQEWPMPLLNWWNSFNWWKNLMSEVTQRQHTVTSMQNFVQEKAWFMQIWDMDNMHEMFHLSETLKKENSSIIDGSQSERQIPCFTMYNNKLRLFHTAGNQEKHN